MLITMIVLMIFSSCMQHSKFIYLCWVFAAILYLGSLLFITIISRQNIHQPIVVKELRFHYIFISRPDPGMPWEDVANVILFIPMGAFLYRFAGKYIHWYGSILTGAICSGLIEYTQYRLNILVRWALPQLSVIIVISHVPQLCFKQLPATSSIHCTFYHF